jgi:hypothetical protein
MKNPNPQHAPLFTPVISLPWMHRAWEVAGASGVLVGFLVWHESALTNHRKTGRNQVPGFSKLTHRKVHAQFGLARETFRSVLTKLKAADLLEVIRPSANSAHQVRLIPLPGEEYWTYSRLGDPSEAQKYEKPPPKKRVAV